MELTASVLALVLLLVAVVLFVIAAMPRVTWGPALPLGLACFAGSFLVRAF